ncbi:hypothetical protein GJ744_005078 [Endocarpon pusillum]|uniref:Uncharacterized protein n=1 Tax=Endocarpon pusillum TaxID=364733 RepID=A0A8H7E8Y6_9EURO|nr:hypothetical protein GJ744_005078 [Endocarpon pusillum]
MFPSKPRADFISLTVSRTNPERIRPLSANLWELCCPVLRAALSTFGPSCGSLTSRFYIPTTIVAVASWPEGEIAINSKSKKERSSRSSSGKSSSSGAQGRQSMSRDCGDLTEGNEIHPSSRKTKDVFH